MFSPPKMKTIVGSLATLLTLVSFATAQDAEYQRRMAAMQKARQRAQTTRPQQDSQVRLASAESGYDYAAPPAPTPQRQLRTASNTRPGTAQPTQRRVARQPQQVPQRAPQRLPNASPIRRASGVSRGYVPNHVRTAQLVNESVVDGGSPIVDGTAVPAPATTMAPSQGAYETVIDGGYVEGPIVDGGYVDGGCGGCGSCVDCCGSTSYFECGDCCGDPCCGRGGCPPGPCWLSGLGGILKNGSYFAGAVGFENPIFGVPDTNIRVQDSNFGYYAGFNWGWPLCRLTCGLLSAQFGFRTVQSSFNGNQFTTVTRDQNFLTFGLYRRVDYGIQGGLVLDYVNERWYAESKMSQLRGDLGFAYPNGSTLGFRFGVPLRDEARNYIVANDDAALITFTQEWYKFYARRETTRYGLGEFYGGWTNNRQAVLGLEFDVPVAERFALQANYTYYVNGDRDEQAQDQLGGNLNDAWNIAVGLVFRPSGRCYYRSYDRPLFDVAHNGSMMIDRRLIPTEDLENVPQN